MSMKHFPDESNNTSPVTKPEQNVQPGNETPAAAPEQNVQPENKAPAAEENTKKEMTAATGSVKPEKVESGKTAGEEDTGVKKRKEHTPMAPRTKRRIRSIVILILFLAIGYGLFLLGQNTAAQKPATPVAITSEATQQPSETSTEAIPESTPVPAATPAPLPLPEGASTLPQNGGAQQNDSGQIGDEIEVSLVDAVHSATIPEKGQRIWGDRQFGEGWTDDTDSYSLKYDESEIMLYLSGSTVIRAYEDVPGKVAKAASAKSLRIEGSPVQKGAWLTAIAKVLPKEKNLVAIRKQDFGMVLGALRHRKEDGNWYFIMKSSGGNGGTKPTPVPTTPPPTNPPTTPPPTTVPTNTPNPTHNPTPTPAPTHNPVPTEAPNPTLPPKTPTLPPKEPTPTPAPTTVPTHNPVTTAVPTHAPVPTEGQSDLPSKSESASPVVVTAAFSAIPTEAPVVNTDGDTVSTATDLPSKGGDQKVTVDTSNDEESDEVTTTTSGGHSAVPQD